MLQEISDVLTKDHLLISIAAGYPIARINANLGKSGTRIVRVMPNTPALVGAGVASLTPNSACTAVDRKIAEMIFSSIGVTYECVE